MLQQTFNSVQGERVLKADGANLDEKGGIRILHVWNQIYGARLDFSYMLSSKWFAIRNKWPKFLGQICTGNQPRWPQTFSWGPWGMFLHSCFFNLVFCQSPPTNRKKTLPTFFRIQELTEAHNWLMIYYDWQGSECMPWMASTGLELALNL